ncbi:hypothetical protein [Dialister sp.]|uniref:hypothetical protein n=1 Tax=Dialister sp. TaxID=1955814 RepID=UPI003EFE94B6
MKAPLEDAALSALQESGTGREPAALQQGAVNCSSVNRLNLDYTNGVIYGSYH